jgi:hypothetical protein
MLVDRCTVVGNTSITLGEGWAIVESIQDDNVARSKLCQRGHWCCLGVWEVLKAHPGQSMRLAQQMHCENSTALRPVGLVPAVDQTPSIDHGPGPLSTCFISASFPSNAEDGLMIGCVYPPSTHLQPAKQILEHGHWHLSTSGYSSSQPRGVRAAIQFRDRTLAAASHTGHQTHIFLVLAAVGG